MLFLCNRRRKFPEGVFLISFSEKNFDPPEAAIAFPTGYACTVRPGGHYALRGLVMLQREGSSCSTSPCSTSEPSATSQAWENVLKLAV